MTVSNYFLDLSSLREGDCVFRESDDNGPGWSLFQNPVQILIAKKLDEVQSLVERSDVFAKAGGFVAMALTYEAAPAFDPALIAQATSGSILAWAAFFRDPQKRFREIAPESEAEIAVSGPGWSPEAYSKAFDQVKGALERGESYQVNLTFPQEFQLGCTPDEFAANRFGVDPPPYAAYLHLGTVRIASLSPELLYERDGEHIKTSPMKGTAVAPENRKELAAAMRAIAADPKAIAENVMIVDMARNDLGAVCDYGSVETTSLLQVEKHRSLLQMTSTVEGQSNAPLWRVLQSLFPAASVTGAPKVETMRLISEIETAPRGFYCGAIGLLKPGYERFSVAIRTAAIDPTTSSGVFGIGSGVVWDSTLDSEYGECLAKRDRLLKSGIEWQLRDAIAVDRISDEERLNQHLDRLEANARAFDVPFDREGIRSDLLVLADDATQAREKVRILLDRGGKWQMARLPSVVESTVMRIALADAPVQSRDPNLRYKTSSRAMLDVARDRRPDCDDVLLYNENGNLTEFGYANVVVEREGQLYTPFVEDGCLAGIGAQEMIDRGEVVRAHIPLKWIREGARVLYVNSVAGLVPTEILSTNPGNSPEFSNSNP